MKILYRIFYFTICNFYFPIATCIIIKIDDIIEEMNVQNNALCTKHVA